MTHQLQFTRRELEHLLDQIKRRSILMHQYMRTAVRWNRAIAQDCGMLGDDRHSQIMLARSPYQILKETRTTLILKERRGLIHNELTREPGLEGKGPDKA